VARRTRVPSYRLHKPTNQAIVVICGKTYYLGRFGSEQSRTEYNRLIAEWLAMGAKARPSASSNAAQPDLTVSELILAYWGHVQSYYSKDGKPTSEVDTVRQALRPVRELYGHTTAAKFGPLALKACQDAMIAKGWARTYINRQINRGRRMFAWAVSCELLPATVHQALITVPGLRKGRSAAKEKPPVAPVPEGIVDKTLEHLLPTVAAMVRLQRLTGMRPQEVVGIRMIDVDMTDPTCWIYRPARHKTQHHGRDRVIFLGPRAQAILRPLLPLDVSAHIFCPKQTVAERGVRQRATRKTPMWKSHLARQAAKRKVRPQRPPGDSYTVGSYRKAIRRACLMAGVQTWHPHQLRHTAATTIRGRFGLEAAQAVLGHSELGTTQVYAERNLTAARAVMSEIG
jgi:integrase